MEYIRDHKAHTAYRLPLSRRRPYPILIPARAILAFTSADHIRNASSKRIPRTILMGPNARSRTAEVLRSFSSRFGMGDTVAP